MVAEILQSLQFVIGFLVLFFGVGFFISKEEDLFERITTSILISLTINILIGWILGLFGIFNFWSLWICVLLVLCTVFYYSRKKGFKFKLKFDKKELSILLLILIGVFVLILNVHGNWFFSNSYLQNSSSINGSYNFPYHSDEWNHLAQSNYLVNEGKLPFENPYFYRIDYALDHSIKNFESGFHVFLGEYEVLTGVDLLLGYRFLPALFAVSSSLVLFVFVRRIYGFKAALFSVVFFVSIKSNVTLLGNWFFVPSTFGVLLMFGLFYSVLSENWFLTSTLFLTSVIVYPPIAILGIISICYKIFSRKYFYLIFVFGILACLAVYFVKVPIFYSLLNQALFFKGWGINFSFKQIPFNVFLLTFGFYGLFNFYDKRKFKFATLFCLANLALILLFLIFSFSIFVPTVRAVYFFQSSLAVFAGVGVYEFVKRFNFDKKYWTVFAVLLIVLFANYYVVSESSKVYTLVGESILEFKGDILTPNIIISDPLISITLTPIFGNPVASIISTNLGGGYRELYYDFVNSDCEGKEEFFKKVNEIYPDSSPYFIMGQPSDCSFLRLVNSNGEYYLYSYEA